MDVFFYNSETRSFGLMGTFGKASAASIGGTVIGTGLGAVIARKKAQKSAEAKGLRPGTPEYNKYVRNRTLGGAAIGGIGGTLVGGTAGLAISGKGFNKTVNQMGGIKNSNVANAVKSPMSNLKLPAPNVSNSVKSPMSNLKLPAPNVSNMTISQFKKLYNDPKAELLDF